MIKTLLIITGLLLAVQSQIYGKNDIDGLVSGFAAFSVNPSDSQQLATLAYQYNFATPLARAPTVSIGIWDANFASSPSSAFEFDVRVNSSTTRAVQFVFRYIPSSWRSLRVGFLASVRNDIYIGSSSISISAITSVTNNLLSSSIVKTVEIGAIDSFQGAVGRAYLNGFALNSNSKAIQVQVEAKAVLQTGLSVAVYTGPETDLRSVVFSYLVFNPSRLPFLAYGGSVVKLRFSGDSYQDVRNTNNLPAPFMAGIVKLGSSLTLNLESSVDNDFVFQTRVQGASADFVYSYAAFGVNTQSICTNAEGRFIYYESCVRECPANSFLFTLRDGALQCRSCSAKLNMVVNAQRNGCVCSPSSQLVNGVCVGAVSTNQNAQQSAGATSSLTTSEEFASRGTGQSGSGIGGINQNINRVTTVTSTGAVVTISNGAGFTPSLVSPTITNGVQISAPVTNFQPQPRPAINPAINPIDNSYVPVTPNQNVVIPNIPTPPPAPATNTSATSATNAQSCANFSNTYWTGYRCSCRVGFRLELPSGQCVRINLNIPNNTNNNPNPIIPNLPPSSCLENEVFTLNQCICVQGFIRGPQGLCIPNIICPPNSYPQGGICVCNNGFVRQGDFCVSAENCGPNAYHNGVICVCRQGFAMGPRRVCEPVNLCPPNSVKNARGDCQCIPGFRQFRRGVCSQCENNAVFINDRCVYTCGVNQEYNTASQRCVCKQGFGFLNSACTVCPADTFLINGYCVRCTVFTVYNQATGRCECRPGFNLANGRCNPVCPTNEVFNNDARRCDCVSGLARLASGQCGVCPPNTIYDASTQTCTQCQQNEVFQNGRCVCATGFGLSCVGCGCVNCATVNAVLQNGYCVSCPGGKVWRNGQCTCPEGRVEQNGQCVAQCSQGQLIDSNGHCYFCPINERPSAAGCVCRDGFVRDSLTRLCQIVCQTGQIVINGVCGTCAMGTVYSQQVRACVCPDGYFFNSQGFCERTIIQCGSGSYLGNAGNCLPCPAGCRNCVAANFCVECQNPAWNIVNGACTPPVPVIRCGNGQLEQGEGCDDWNGNNGDGCDAFCRVESGYTCNGSPSVCIRPVQSPCGNGLPNPGEQCDDRNTASGDGCSANCYVEQGYTCTQATPFSPSVCRPNTPNPNQGMSLVSIVNNNNMVYVTLELAVAFQFASSSEMSQLIQYEINSTVRPSSVACRQREREAKRFDCLMNYPGGVPRSPYDASFWYQRDGYQGRYVATIDTSRPNSSIRSRK